MIKSLSFWIGFFSCHRLQSHHCIGQNLNETRLTDWRKLYLFENLISSTLRLYCAIKCLSVKWMPGAVNDVGWYFNACCFCLCKIWLNIDFPQILKLFDIFSVHRKCLEFMTMSTKVKFSWQYDVIQISICQFHLKSMVNYYTILISSIHTLFYGIFPPRLDASYPFPNGCDVLSVLIAFSVMKIERFTVRGVVEILYITVSDSHPVYVHNGVIYSFKA